MYALPLRFIALFALLIASANACAVTREEVVAGAAKMYRERIGDLAKARMLDRDPEFLSRIRRIAQRLDEQARRDNPATAAWKWEIHSSTDNEDNASCMAGGKILVSQPYIERLDLTDAELAMVLSHEMQHAILLHNLKEYEEALRLDPSWKSRPFAELEDAVDNNFRLMMKLADINREQEIEADRAGLAMAWRAGWPAKELAGYFRKLENASSMGRSSSAIHAAPMQRWRAARKQAEELGG